MRQVCECSLCRVLALRLQVGGTMMCHRATGQETRLEDTGPKSAEQHSCPDMLAPPLPSHVSQVQGHSNTQLFCMPYKLAAVSYDRGVLQESIMHLEIFVTRLFDALRMLLRSLLLLPPSKPMRSPSVTVYQRRSSFHEMVCPCQCISLSLNDK